MNGDLTDEQYVKFAKTRIARDLDVLNKYGAVGKAQVRIDRGVVLITNADERRTWVAAVAVLDSGDLSPTLN